MSRLIEREQIISEVNEKMSNNEIVDMNYFISKFNISRATFYNILNENDIDIQTYNRVTKKNFKNNFNESKEEVKEKVKVSAAAYDKEFGKLVVHGEGYEIYSKNKNRPEVKKEETVKKVDENTIEVSTIETYTDIIGNTFNLYPYTQTSNSCKIARLISNRHSNIDDSINDYIYYGPVRSDMIHDYKKLYDIAYNFIQTKVIDEGYNRLKVAVTGLTQCCVAVIKAAYALNIELILMHYDNVSGKYCNQIATQSDCDNTSDTSLLDLYANVKKDYVFKLVDYDNNYYKGLIKIYTVKTENMTNPGAVVYVTDNIDKMFSIYTNEIKKAKEIKFETIRVISNEIVFGSTNTEFKFSDTFGTYYNQERTQ